MSKLRLVVSNPDPAPAPARKKVAPVSQAAPPKERFSVDMTRKGPHLYGIDIQDPSHHLTCTLEVEVEESDDLDEGIADGTVICYFPPIDDESLNEFIESDDMLYGMLIVQFQMRILELLLVFCSNHYASQLIIYMDNREVEKFGVYEAFLSHYGKALTPGGEKTEMVIPTGPEMYEEWIEFMDTTSQNFRQTLWRDQVFNPVIQSYLKWDPMLQFFD